MINDSIVYFMERNIHGAWVVYGASGVKQYYGYTKEEARRMYIEAHKSVTFTNVRRVSDGRRSET